MSENGRNPNGRFAPGNKLGPGRPRRQTERDFLKTLADVAEPAWPAICAAAVEAARAGDPKSREWIAKFLIGEPVRGALAKIAAAEQQGSDPGEEAIASEIEHREIAATLMRAIQPDSD